MRWLDLIHRWTGGVIGLVLAILGLTGAILVHRDDWIGVRHSSDALVTDPAAIAAATQRMLGNGEDIQGIVYATERLGLHQLRFAHGAGAYADQSGVIVERWASQWARPELWLFDLHHHLFAGDIGETIGGIAGLAAILFVVTGTILWFRTRRTFKFRLLPKRLSRAAIVMHHRDLGIVVAPLLLLSGLTGAMMIFKPVAAIVVAPFSSPSEVTAAMTPPKLHSAPLAAHPDWRAMVLTAQRRFPDARLRILALPRKVGDPIAIRMKRATEWLPNGRTMLWLDAGNGRLLATRDALAMPAGAQVFNAAYPLHAAKIGGLAYRLLMTCSGLAMLLLGTLAVWTFWFRPRPSPRPRPAKA
ncbi:PepSY-associated TM helix domain-containing protein [Sphingomonas sp. GB1N7]|uniref:PepSY-associated TM helix domain-containing protein n=1 Tax=Parasphingomonas caseinilytica TaxID=3096158 RepID=UPI002FC9707E